MMHPLRRRLATFALAAGALAAPALAGDGVVPIDPACVASGCFAGDAPGFPVTIAAAGTYALTGNLVNPSANQDAIVVQSADVTLDLGGFAVRGPVTCSGAGAGVACSASGSGVGVRSTAVRTTLRNGTIRGNGAAGAVLGGANSRVEALRFFENAGRGLDATAGAGAVATGCAFVRNGGDGAAAGDAAQLRESVARDNFGDGLALGASGALVRDVATANGQNGLSATGASDVRQSFATANLRGAQLGGASGYGASVFRNNFAATVNGGPPAPVQIGANECNGTTTCP